MPAEMKIHSHQAALHRHILVTLTRTLMQEQSGGIFSATIEILSRGLSGVFGLIAYRAEPEQLVLVGEKNLPRDAKDHLAFLSLRQTSRFAAQRAAMEQRHRIEAQDEQSLRLFQDERWRHLAAVPVVIGRQLLGVIVLSSIRAEIFDRATTTLLQTVCEIVALALSREQELRRLREQRLQDTRTAQLASLGLLASVVSHDLRAPLDNMRLQLEEHGELLEMVRSVAGAMAQLDELDELSRDLAANHHRAQTVAEQLDAFSKKTAPSRHDLADIARATVELIQDYVETRNIALSVSGGELPMPVMGRQESLQMLMLQLLLHAAEECAASRSEAPVIRLALGSEEGCQVVSIESTGGPASSRSRGDIFNVFLSKRQLDGQLDLGLGLAKQSVLSHGGHLEIGASELGGTLVRVLFPAARPKPPETEPRRDGSTLPPDSDERPAILWIDEDTLLVRSMQRRIKSHESYGASSLKEARRLLETIEPTLVFCDLILPDGYGTDLHAELEPSMAERFVFITGGVINPAIAEYVRATSCPTLIKPLSVDEIRSLLSERDGDMRHSHSIIPTLSRETEPPR